MPQMYLYLSVEIEREVRAIAEEYSIPESRVLAVLVRERKLWENSGRRSIELLEQIAVAVGVGESNIANVLEEGGDRVE